jgi:hypothetical protein
MPDISLFVVGNGVGVCDISEDAKNMLNRLIAQLTSTALAASNRCHRTVSDKTEAEYIHLYTLETEICDKLPNMIAFDAESTIFSSAGFDDFMQVAKKMQSSREKNSGKRSRLREKLCIKYQDEHEGKLDALRIMPEVHFVAFIKGVSAKINLEQVQIDIEGHAAAYKHAQTAHSAGSTSSRDQNRHRETMKVNKKKLIKSVLLYNKIRAIGRGDITGDIHHEDELTVDGFLSGDLTVIPWVRDYCMQNSGGLFAIRQIKLAEAWGTVLRLQEQPDAKLQRSLQVTRGQIGGGLGRHGAGFQ